MENIDKFVPKQTTDDIKLTLSGNYEEFKAFKKSEKYKEISKSGAKVVFKVEKKKKMICEKSTESDFKKILYLFGDMKNILKFYFMKQFIFLVLINMIIMLII